MAVDYQIVSEISIKEKSQIYLITIDNMPPFYILKRYLDEAVCPVLEQLKDLNSPFFPQIIDMWKDDGKIYVIEEYVSGKTLREIIEEGGLSVSEIKRYMIMLCEAMKALHSHEPKLVHRDIKPENILLDRNGQLKLIDFDATRMYKAETNYDTVLMGTKEYAAPEQFGFRQTDERSDIYSAGIVLKELLNSCAEKNSKAHALMRVTDKATMFEPEKRFQSAEQLEREIKKNSMVPYWWIYITVILLALIGIVIITHNRNNIELDENNTTGESESETESITEEMTTTQPVTEEPTTQVRFENIDEEYAVSTWYEMVDDHIEFWGFHDGYRYPQKIYLESEINGIPVTVIGAYALAGKYVTELHVPSSITIIGEGAFEFNKIVFYGEKGSYIEEYCKKHGRKFVEEQNNGEAN